jgi:DNA-binding LytR/AlgR family response regulator
MYKLCLNSRDELLIITLDNIAYLQANGNYTQLKYIGGEDRLITIGISKIEDFIRQTWPKDRQSPFIRLGRSLIINQRFLSGISVLKQKVILSDNAGHSYALSVPKPLLKEYKERINEFYSAHTETD